MKRLVWRMAHAGLAVLALGTAAHAGETLVPKLMLGSEDFNIRFYGQFDPALLIADDGDSTLGYGPVNNDNASTRIGLLFHARVNADLAIGANVEGGYDPYSTDYVNQTNRGDPDWNRTLLRKAEVYTNSARFGALWIGQGNMASDGISEFDLSGTTVVGYSSVGDLAGGQLFALSGGKGLSTVSVTSVYDDLDGLGRKLRVRYDTPSIAGFTLSGSYGTDVVPQPAGGDLWDVALRYAGSFGGLRINSGFAVSDTGSGGTRYNGSVSTLHVPTGISLTAAAGYDDDKDGVDGRFVYGKLGYQKQFLAQGVTAFSVDVYSGADIASAGSQSFSWGAQVVQNFDYYQAQAYVGFRSYEYDERTASYDRIVAVLTGVLIEF